MRMWIPNDAANDLAINRILFCGILFDITIGFKKIMDKSIQM